jgi:outer membrane cobalamin receptor
MTTNLFVRRAVRCTLFTSAAAALVGALPAQAQQQAPQETQNIQEVVVTGSRIAQPGLTTSAR